MHKLNVRHGRIEYKGGFVGNEYASDTSEQRFEDSGCYEQTYLKVRERADGASGSNGANGEAVLVSEGVNEVGVMPAVVHYNTKPLERGVAVSDLQDVTRMLVFRGW